MTPADLVVLTGPPGAGKTTVSRLLAEHFEPTSCLLESDWWWTTIVKGHIPAWLSAAHSQNRAVVQSFSSAACVMAAAGFPTVLEGIVGPWMLDLVVAEARAAEVHLHYVVLRPTLPVALERAQSREDDGRVPGHPPLTDPGPITKMWHEFAGLERYEDHVVDNTTMNPQQTADLVYDRVRDGSLAVAPTTG